MGERLRLGGITGARKPVRNACQYLKIRSPETRNVIALPYDSLSFSLPPDPPDLPAGTKPVSISSRQDRESRAILLPEQGETYNPVER